MTTEKLCKKIFIKIVIFVCIAIFVSGLLNAGNTIISNQLALEQMENSDGMYMLMEVYNSAIKPTVYIGLIASGIFVTVSIGYNVYNFIKDKKENN